MFAGAGFVIELRSRVTGIGPLVKRSVDGKMQQVGVFGCYPLQQPVVTLVRVGHFQFGDVVAPNVTSDHFHCLANGQRGYAQAQQPQRSGHVRARHFKEVLLEPFAFAVNTSNQLCLPSQLNFVTTLEYVYCFVI